MTIADALYHYGRESSDNLTKLKGWRDEALADIADGKGTTLVSGAGNGLNFALSSDMTVSDWFTALQAAILRISKKHSSVRHVRF